MRKLRIFEHISQDGVIAPDSQDDNNNEWANSGWMGPFRTADGRDAIVEAQGERFDLVLGRRTYDLWSGYWPNVKEGLFADKINSATKHIATHRPETLKWGPVQSLGTDIAIGVGKVKSEAGPDLILWGSSTLTSSLLAQGLVDEVVLIVYPVLLGLGKRLFSESTAPQRLSLVNSKATSTGVLFNSYRYVGPHSRG